MKRSRLFLLATGILVAASYSFAQNEDQTVYVTKTGKKYHVASCSYLKSSTAISLADAVKRYSPCSKCNPPTATTIKAPSSIQSIPKDTIVQIKADEPKKKSGETAIGTTPTGKTLYQGPRGGQYHYSKSGKKVYHKRMK
ncbi:MAG TPA: hypothetical protein VJ044_07660 [Candidatus Hodarchaeales archaeon]|nr:hypothetical protein [Candidatus Hodarchaeales archaeon]